MLPCVGPLVMAASDPLQRHCVKRIRHVLAVTNKMGAANPEMPPRLPAGNDIFVEITLF
jgi:hypothetical protein